MWSFYISGTKHTIFQQEKLFWMLCFGVVSGHDFSRAVQGLKENWASAPAMAHPARTLVGRQAKKKSAGAKAQIFVEPQRPD
jgi:hypothetical protein